MGWHHTFTERNIHMPYRWVVPNEASRLSITTNQDGTELTPTDGLHCKCLQTDTKAEYVVIGINPVQWIKIGGDHSDRKVLFNVHVPQKTCDFTGDSALNAPDIFFKRMPVNIAENSGSYDRCLWDIAEIDSGGNQVSSWIREQFADYTALIDFLNTTIAASTTNTYNLSISAYVDEDASIAPFTKIYGINRFFSVLKGKENYKSSRFDSKTIGESNMWEHLPVFITGLYDEFLGVPAPPLSNALRTVWFPQSRRRIYDHHTQPITFQNGNSSVRRYYLKTNATTYAGVNGGTWLFSQKRYFALADNSTEWVSLGSVCKDKDSTSGSVVCVSMYVSASDQEKVCFFVKPVGMDLFHLGFHPALQEEPCGVYAEYKHPNGHTRIKKIKEVDLQQLERSYGMNTSVSVTNSDFVSLIVPNGCRSHVRSDSIIGTVRFRVITDSGRSFPASDSVTIHQGKGHVNSFVLLN